MSQFSFILSRDDDYLVKVLSLSSNVLCSGQNISFQHILCSFTKHFGKVPVEGFTECEAIQYMTVNDDKDEDEVEYAYDDVKNLCRLNPLLLSFARLKGRQGIDWCAKVNGAVNKYIEENLGVISSVPKTAENFLIKERFAECATLAHHVFTGEPLSQEDDDKYF